MKARLPSEYQLFAMNYSLESMLFHIANISYSIYKENSTGNPLGQFFNYSFGNRIYRVTGCQTWLIDLIYDLCCSWNIGTETIDRNKTLHLINLYNKHCNKKPNISIKDFMLYVYGFLGEQLGVQVQRELFNAFAREIYVLESISQKDNKYQIDINHVFQDITGFSMHDYSLLLFSVWGIFAYYGGIIKKDELALAFSNQVITKENLYSVLDKYSVSIDSIKGNPLGRQIFYSSPFLVTDTKYISSNSYLTLYTFAHSNYWILRNHYEKKKSQDFLNAFGEYFEIYVGEIFHNCLKESEYKRIDPCEQKRADWILHLFGQDIIIEQKSALTFLKTKQNNSDVDATKQYILRTWKKAVQQLHETEKALHCDKPVKIILLYENYLTCECLDELFRMDSSLTDDRRYWLITIDEFERFLFLYKTNPALAQKVFEAKQTVELTKDLNGRSLEKILEENDVLDNQYLQQFEITEKFDSILKSLKASGDKT